MPTLIDIIQRAQPATPWLEGEKIPWHEPAFSARMLREHLSQDHDAASRRHTIIQQQVAWIYETLLSEKPSRLLDLGCGPGFYCHLLAENGHTCVGIDFSPASIGYARQHALPTCDYRQGDIRSTDYGSGFDLVMLIFGEFNVFRKTDAEAILRKAHHALVSGGTLLLEPHTFAYVQHLGQQAPRWYSREQGLFSEQPHLVLMDYHWQAESALTTERYYIVDAGSGDVTRYASSMQAYTNADYTALLTECGFRDVQFFDSFGIPKHEALIVLTARKP